MVLVIDAMGVENGFPGECPNIGIATIKSRGIRVMIKSDLIGDIRITPVGCGGQVVEDHAAYTEDNDSRVYFPPDGIIESRQCLHFYKPRLLECKRVKQSF